MKEYKKKELLKMLTTLEEANKLIIKEYKQNAEGAMDLLAQCQEAALAIGNCLESQKEEWGKIIRLLEDYCEMLYQMSLVLGNENQCKKNAKQIQKKLIEIKKQIREELPEEKKEVIFLPYKASMWDSLESVWKSASEDTNCDTHVIPIPYFERKNDGSLGQMHYEGDQYPDYVPITSWKEYSIPDRRPDVIYIHNPYDECNNVTSVHPDFYARKLKKYTEMLIYIPYFVCVNNVVKDEFCVLPGTIYADKVILQSKEVRRDYIKIYHQWEDSQKCRDQFGKAEDKFVAGGSPKFDKVASSKKEDFEMPPEWGRLINREDGNCRKVILYNTSLANMLNDTEKMLVKIKDVFRIFQSQEEVILLWRPHPLFRETIQAMRNEYLREYDAIVEKYRQGRWGIFDDSSDLYRAITISDAYYGDGSSVMELYKHTGKPIMIQDILITSENIQ